MELKERFLKYVGFDTQSDPESETYPSTAKQLVLLNHLAEEMKSIGLQEVEVDANGYAMGTIPATSGATNLAGLFPGRTRRMPARKPRRGLTRQRNLPMIS